MLVQEVKQNAAHYFNLVTRSIIGRRKSIFTTNLPKDYESHCYITAKTEEKVSAPKMKNIPIE